MFYNMLQYSAQSTMFAVKDDVDRTLTFSS